MAFSNANILSLNAASTNITTASYVQISASTPINMTRMYVINATSSVLILGYGASGSEIGYVAIPASSAGSYDVGLNVIPAGSRIAVIAQSATASSGYVTVSLMP